MNWLRRGSSGGTASEPLSKEEFSVRTADERYVTRRQLTKFLVLTSLGMFVGNIWILIRSLFFKAPVYPPQPVAQLGEIPIRYGTDIQAYYGLENNRPRMKDECISGL